MPRVGWVYSGGTVPESKLEGSAGAPLMAPLTKRNRGVIKAATNAWFAKNNSLVLRQTPRWAQGLALVFISLGGIALVGGFVFRIDEVITVQGQLVSTAGNQEVKTPAGGKVRAVYVRDGDRVRSGQLLLRFDTRQAADEQATLSRLIRLEQEDLQEKLQILRGREQVVAQKLRTQQGITQELQKLVQNGGFQKVQYLQELDRQLEMQNNLAQIKLDRRRTQLESEKSIGQMRNRLRQAEVQLQYQIVRAPLDGVVFEQKARAEGVLSPGQTILTLVPQTGLRAEVAVSNRDIGLVKLGQKAKVRVDAFPFSRYGELDGRVSRIGADALPPDERLNQYRFPVTINLNRSYLQTDGVKIPLRSGMAVTSNLKLREKPVISLLSDLLVNQTESVKSLRQQ